MSQTDEMPQAIEPTILPETMQLDFWVGEWEVKADGKSVGTSLIEKLHNGCLIVKNWIGRVVGATGKSMNKDARSLVFLQNSPEKNQIHSGILTVKYQPVIERPVVKPATRK